MHLSGVGGLQESSPHPKEASDGLQGSAMGTGVWDQPSLEAETWSSAFPTPPGTALALEAAFQPSPIPLPVAVPPSLKPQQTKPSRAGGAA